MKRAQRFQLEDQRGTEINFELPDFLKANNTNTWKNTNNSASDAIKDGNDTNELNKKKGKAPQPAPRLSISRSTPIDNSSLSEATNECAERKQSTHSSYSQGNNIKIEEILDFCYIPFQQFR